jgi:glycerol-3-phosphate acyltransferase PlsY
MALAFIAAALGGYFLGSIPFGLVLTRLAGLGDIRAIGSGNIGATNVLRTGRKDIALATLLLDAGKAAAALLIARALASEHEFRIELGLVAGGAAYIGHCFPIWLGFKGGKGVATFFGVLLAGIWPVGLVAAFTWLAVAAMFRFSSLAALCAAIAAPLFALIGQFDWSEIVFTALIAILIIVRHWSNITRLLNGTEPRIGDKKPEPETTESEPGAATAEATQTETPLSANTSANPSPDAPPQ